MIREKMAAAGEMIKNHKKSLLVLFVFVLLGVALHLRDQQESEAFQGVVEREVASGNTKSRSFWFHLEEESGAGNDASIAEEIGERELDLEISPVELNREEAFSLLEKAVDEWEDGYLGENSSPEEVQKELVLPSTICDGLVKISYESSDYEILNTDGTVETSSLTQEGKLVELTARFSYGEYTRIETYALMVKPSPKGSADWILGELEKEALQTEENSR